MVCKWQKIGNNSGIIFWIGRVKIWSHKISVEEVEECQNFEIGDLKLKDKGTV